jgi:ribonuclease Z
MLRTDTTDVLIDCGEGTQRQLMLAGLGMGKVTHILLTHLHGDHYFGLPGLLSSLGLNGRTAPLSITSPQHLRPRLSALLEMDKYDLPFDVNFHTFHATELTPLHQDGDLEILAFPLQHRIATNGYLLREKPREANISKDAVAEYDIPWPIIKKIKAGEDYRLSDGTVIPNDKLITPPPPPRSYAHCSDTIYFPELADFVRDVDLLYHEATFLQDMAEDATKKGHATAEQAAMIARDAGVGQLVMGHFSTRYENGAAHEQEARAIFANSHAGDDLWRIEVPFTKR